jgi:hypothetical protein
MAMVSNLQVLCLAIPILIIVSENPGSNFFIRSGVIVLNDFSVQCFIFIPKILATHWASKFGNLASTTATQGTSGTAATNSGTVGTSSYQVAPEPQSRQVKGTGQAERADRSTVIVPNAAV